MERKTRMKQETKIDYLAYFILCIQDIQNAGSRC